MTQDEQLDRALRELREQLPAAHGDAAAGPVGPVLAAARARVLERVAPAPGHAGIVEGWRARERRRWALPAAAATVAALVAGGMLVGFPGTGPGQAQAREVLERAAAEAIEATDPPLRPGQYRYLQTRSWHLSGGASTTDGAGTLVEDRIRYWVPVDPRGDWLMIRSDAGQLPPIGSAKGEPAPAEQSVQPDGSWRVTAPCGRFYGGEDGDLCTGPGTWLSPTPEFLAGLPRDPDELLVRLERDAPVNSRGHTELLVYAADLLRSPALVPADLRSALYLALSRIDGLTTTSGSINLDGRPGTALGIDNGTDRTEIIVDPATGAFIGEREVITGAVTTYTSVSTGVADSIGEPPAR